jgi:hypothetical protein
LQNVWTLHQKHHALRNNAAQYQACATKRLVVATELSWHELVYAPATESRHLTGRAFDDGSVEFKVAMGRNPTKMLASNTTASPACTLVWGGSWRKPDDVHFELTGP